MAVSVVVAIMGCSIAGGSAKDVGVGSDAGGVHDAAAAPEGGNLVGGSLLLDGGTLPALPDGSTIAMPHISVGASAYASDSQNSARGPDAGTSDDPTSSWQPNDVPAWIALDLSGVPATERHNILFAWTAPIAGTYLNSSPPPSGGLMPTSYTLDINNAPGGTSAPPTSGWTSPVTVTSNLLAAPQSLFSLAGGNWVRLTISASTDSYVAIDLDVFSAPLGATDSWLFMGDSITYESLRYVDSDLPSLVHQARPDRWPAVICAAVGGTNTQTAAGTIGPTMAGFPGRYVALPYGTNDQPTMFEMETLVQDVIAVGKVPVVPTMPWASGSTNGPAINQQIQALYVKYPQILPGPDLWTAFENRTDLIPVGDVHPNAAGQEVLRQQWATMMAAIP
jgi:hypothetical protein